MDVGFGLLVFTNVEAMKSFGEEGRTETGRDTVDIDAGTVAVEGSVVNSGTKDGFW